VSVECLIGKQKKPILVKVTEPSSIPYRTPPKRLLIPKHHSVSQQTVCLVLSLGYPTSRVGKRKWKRKKKGEKGEGREKVEGFWHSRLITSLIHH
jgi:hypothetical protein